MRNAQKRGIRARKELPSPAPPIRGESEREIDNAAVQPDFSMLAKKAKKDDKKRD